jgi:ParB-like chromosome segregation protein Spo0J
MTSTFEAHPLASAFPLMRGAEFDELVADVRANGLIEPIVIYEGQVLDGRNRLRACQAAGIEPRFEPFVGDDPAAFVISANVHRRHLTGEQKRDVIAALLKTEPARSDRQIAKIAKVDNKTVASVRAQKEATEEIPQLKNRVGKDGKARKQPARKDRAKTRGTLEVATVGPDSSGEAERLPARNEELENDARRLEREVLALRGELEDTKARKPRSAGLLRDLWKSKGASEIADILVSQLPADKLERLAEELTRTVAAGKHLGRYEATAAAPPPPVLARTPAAAPITMLDDPGPLPDFLRRTPPAGQA